MKTTNIILRVDTDEKLDIKNAAEKSNRTVSDYLLWLHRKHILHDKEKGAESHVLHEIPPLNR